MKKRRPNGWDKLYRGGAAVARQVLTCDPERPSAFELKLKQLHIREDQATNNGKMVAWIRANHTR